MSDYVNAKCKTCGQKMLIAMNAWEQNYHLKHGCDSCSQKLSLLDKIIRKVSGGWYVYEEGKDIINGEILSAEFWPNNYKKIRKQKLSKLLGK